MGMESFADRAISAMCASNVIDQHIQDLVYRPDGLLVVIKVPNQDTLQVREKVCSILRRFASQGNPFKATTESFSCDGFDYLIALLAEEEAA